MSSTNLYGGEEIAENGLNRIAEALRCRNQIEEKKLELEREKFEFEKKSRIRQVMEI